MNQDEKYYKELRAIIYEEVGKLFIRPLTELNWRIQAEEIIYEGLIYTYSVTETIRRLVKIGIKEDNITHEIENGTNVLYVTISPNKRIYKKIDKEMQLYGWFFNSVTNHNIDTYKEFKDGVRNAEGFPINLVYTAKFNVELDITEKQSELYHVTTESRLDNIMEIGLTPKSNSKLNNHPERIHFMKKYDNIHIEGLVEHLFTTEKLDYTYKKEYVLLRINMTGGFPIRLFNDPDSINACYTLENIPPSRITLIRKYGLNERGKVTRKENISNI